MADVSFVIFVIAFLIFSCFCFFLGIDHMKHFDFGIGIVLILLGFILGITAIISLV